MAYDLEKYREKREKVLGVKKRGISFGTLATIVSLLIILGLGVVVVPKSIAYCNLNCGAAFENEVVCLRPRCVVF